ncbi:hypothetical protein FRC18_002018 [Serendipita sp. 400]|nr:hypothetical protein FRC18_002018 [Serendipita sp. 400]
MASDESFRLAELEGLVPTLLKVYSMVYDVPYPPKGDGNKPSTPQEIVEAADDFKRRLQAARETIDSLPGGDVDVEGQEEIIKMLEKWRDLKREQLRKKFTEAP